MKNNIGEARRQYADRVGGFTQTDAAEFFGVSLSTYKKWEQGKGMMNGEILREIAMKYKTTSDYLLGITDVYQVETEMPDYEEMAYDEQELLIYYRMLTDKGKHAVLVGLRDFANASK